MADLHGTFIAAAYGLTAVAIVAELVALWSRRRKAIDRIRRERDFDEDERGG
jgi:heme exporter protein CcmD